MSGGKGAQRRYNERHHQLMVEQHPDAVAGIRALAEEDLADDELCRHLALWVRAFRKENGGQQGPSWSVIALQVRPDLGEVAPAYFLRKVYIEHLLAGLTDRGWLRCGHSPGSTRQGARLYEDGTLPGKAGLQAEPAAV